MAVKTISRELLAQDRPMIPFKEGTVLKDHLRLRVEGNSQVHEFVGTDNFAAAFYLRQEYEVDSGRLEEPTLYEPLYSILEDRNLPEIVAVNRLGPAGVVFQRVVEGGETKFASLGESNFTVPIYHHSVGFKYSDDLVEYNKLFSITEVEREAGSAYNALLNHLHFSPFLEFSYQAKNQTTGVGVTYEANTKLPEAYLRTLELAITNAVADKPSNRRGPYAILTSSANLFTLERAFSVVPQLGITAQSSALARVSTIIAYDGWTGNMGELTFEYAGVPAGKIYLIDLGRRKRNHRSYVKHGLRRIQGNADVSRFILEQTIWDARFGVYADPANSTEEITLPTIDDVTP